MRIETLWNLWISIWNWLEDKLTTVMNFKNLMWQTFNRNFERERFCNRVCRLSLMINYLLNWLVGELKRSSVRLDWKCEGLGTQESKLWRVLVGSSIIPRWVTWNSAKKDFFGLFTTWRTNIYACNIYISFKFACLFCFVLLFSFVWKTSCLCPLCAYILLLISTEFSPC